MLNSLICNVSCLENQNFTIVVLFLVSAMLIPEMITDVDAKTYDVVIPRGADNPKNVIHYLPSELTVSVDDKIRWLNFDDSTHTVTSGSFQSGPNGIFNSGLLENSEVFTYIIDSADIGTLSYYCTIHPWMNGIILVMDPEGLPVGSITETGSAEAAQEHIEKAESSIIEAEKFLAISKDFEAAEAFSLAANHYNKAALEYSLLGNNEQSAISHQKSAAQHHNAAKQYENADDYEKSIIEHYNAGIQNHFAAIQYEFINQQENMRKQLSESLLHKRMAKFGSEYVLPPKHQARYLDVNDITCKENFELLIKITTKEPVCIKSIHSEKLIDRGWATRILEE